MRVVVLTLTLYAPWVHSLKEKRMEIKSLLQRLRNKFNVIICNFSFDCNTQIGNKKSNALKIAS